MTGVRPKAVRWHALPASAVFAVIMALVVAGGACGTEPETGAPSTSVTPVITQPGPSSSAPLAPTSDPDPAVRGAVEWGDQTKVIELGDGWKIGACEGDAPLLCVSNGGRTAGIVEGSRFPVDSIAVLDSDASDLANLRALASNFVASVRSDRSRGCPEGYVVQPLEQAHVQIGGADALRYGFTGRNPDGSLSELNLQYVTIAGEDLVLITAIAYDDGGCPGRADVLEFDSKTLAALQPRLESAMRHIPLPPSPM